VTPIEPTNIAITGASSGIGRALAIHYARPGRRLSLAGRDMARLEAVAADCRKQGAEAATITFDQRDAALGRAWIGAIDDAGAIDLLIANAGMSAGTHGGSESEAQVRAIFDVNVTGVLNVVLPAIERMERRGRGQIGLMSSLAGHRGFPGAPAYCASKAAIKVWGEGLRGHCSAKNVRVSVIMPGYVRTPMTDVNDFAMPFLMSADKAASIIAKGLARDRARIAFPFPTAAMAWFLGIFSPALTDSLLSRLPRKR
jgi:short-subunit dehydrogenase